MSYYMIKKDKMSTPNAAGEEKHPRGCLGFALFPRTPRFHLNKNPRLIGRGVNSWLDLLYGAFAITVQADNVAVPLGPQNLFSACEILVARLAVALIGGFHGSTPHLRTSCDISEAIVTSSYDPPTPTCVRVAT